MPVDERELRNRRVKRAVKAGVSIVLAVAAGAFLACQRTVTRGQERSPMGPDARTGPPPTAPDGATDSASDRASGAPLAALDAGASDAAEEAFDAPDAETDADGQIVVRDAAGEIVLRRPPRRPRHRVDRDEHRRGLPVLDNLLE